MDFGVIGGLMLAVGAVLVANAIEGGSVASLVNPSAAVLILGGTLGATAASTGLRGVLSLPRSLVSALRPLPYDNEATAEALVALAVKARREGLLALEDDARAQADPFFARGLQLVVDGADPDMLEGVLLGEAVLARRRREQDARVFETAGGYAPTMGIIGTVMGLIHVLGNLENPSELGPAIAVAFLATFYGIFTANVFWLPVSQRLKENAAAEAEYRQLITEGLLAIQQGDNPAIVREKLRAFLSHSGESAGAGARGAVARETA